MTGARSARRLLPTMASRATMAAARIAPISWLSGCPPERTRNVAPATAATLARLPLRAARRADSRRSGTAAATMVCGCCNQATKAPERENPTAPSEAASRERPRSRSQKKAATAARRMRKSSDKFQPRSTPSRRAGQTSGEPRAQTELPRSGSPPPWWGFQIGSRPAHTSSWANRSQGTNCQTGSVSIGMCRVTAVRLGLQGQHRDLTSLESSSPRCISSARTTTKANTAKTQLDRSPRALQARASDPVRVALCHTPICASIQGALPAPALTHLELSRSAECRVSGHV